MPRIDVRAALDVLVCSTLAASCADVVRPDATPNPPAGITASPGPAAPAAGRSDSATLRIVVTTSGTDLDPDGYRLTLDYRSLTAAAIPVNDSVDLRVAVGRKALRLTDVAPNCVVAGKGWWGDVQLIDVPAGTAGEPAVQARFGVSCETLPTGRLPAGTELAFVRNGQIWRVSSDGTGARQLSAGPGDADPAWSPDGRRIAFSRQSERRDQWGRRLRAIYVMDADGANVAQVTNDSYGREPAWSPDGRRIALSSLCPDGVGLQGCVLVASVDAPNAGLARVGWSRGQHESPAWSPDGTRIAFTSDWAAYDFVSDLYVATLSDGRIAQLTFGFRSGDEGSIELFKQPAWSPDGRQLAFVVCPDSYFVCSSGSITVVSPDGSRRRTLVSTRGYSRPTWSPDGRTIAYAAGGILWVTADGGARGLIVADGESPAWRPSP